MSPFEQVGFIYDYYRAHLFLHINSLQVSGMLGSIFVLIRVLRLEQCSHDDAYKHYTTKLYVRLELLHTVIRVVQVH